MQSKVEDRDAVDRGKRSVRKDGWIALIGCRRYAVVRLDDGIIVASLLVMMINMAVFYNLKWSSCKT